MLTRVTDIAEANSLDTKIALDVADTSHNVFFINQIPVVQCAFMRNFIAEVREAAVLAVQDFDLTDLAAKITFAVEADPHYRHYDAIIAMIENDSDLPQEAYDDLYSFYLGRAEIPYEVAKARSADPYEWVSDRVRQYMGAQ